ncbi:hypothetical protein JTB14_009392 [Gonioctena quinquepunctata]|nr:hypothetical protein JTB14_009392 [Gonioctena quinquepunctata]
MQLWYPKQLSSQVIPADENSSTPEYYPVENEIPAEECVGTDSENEDNEQCFPLSIESANSEKSEIVEIDYFTESTSNTNSNEIASPENYSSTSDLQQSEEENDGQSDSSYNNDIVSVSDFVDPSYWREEKLCCGTIFRGQYNEILIDTRFLSACPDRLRNNVISSEKKQNHAN